jgi:hypothetical protein
MAMSAPALAKQDRLECIGDSRLSKPMNFQRMPLREQVKKKPPATPICVLLSFHCVRTGLEISIASGWAIECSCGRSNHYTPFLGKGNEFSFVFSMVRRKILTLELAKWYSGPTGFRFHLAPCEKPDSGSEGAGSRRRKRLHENRING